MGAKVSSKIHLIEQFLNGCDTDACDFFHISQSKRRFSPDNIQGKDKKRGRTVNVRPLLFFL